MRKIIIAAVMLFGVSQAFAAKSYDQKYREAMEKHIELSGTARFIEQAMGVTFGVTAMKKSKEMDMVVQALPGLLVVALEPSYKKHLTLKELRRYNRVMSRRAARKFRETRPEIIGDVILNAEKIEQQLKEYWEEVEKNAEVTTIEE